MKFLVAVLMILPPAEGIMGRFTARHPQDGPHADLRITVDHDAIRFFVVMNLVFIDEITDCPREDQEALDPVEEPIVKEALEAFFSERNRVTIDDVVVNPLLSGFEVDRPGTDLLPLFPLSGMRGLIRVRVRLDYPVKSQPQKATFHWSAYPLDILARTTGGEPSTLVIEAQLAAEGETKIIRFTKEDPQYVWHASGLTLEQRFLPVPDVSTLPPRTIPLAALSIAAFTIAACAFLLFRACPLKTVIVIVLIGAVTAFSLRDKGLIEVGEAHATVKGEDAISIFRSLHTNIYRAFDYTSESDIYDALARSVDGALLNKLYNQIHESLIMQLEEGGAVSRVQKVEPLDATVVHDVEARPDDRLGFTVRARWRVEGAVYHWGHSHARTNEYDATYRIERTDKGWRIIDNEILEQKRVDEPFFLAPGEDW